MTKCIKQFSCQFVTLAAILAVTSSSGIGGEISIVSPSEFADKEAPDGRIGDGSARVQILYEASDFSPLSGPHWITQFAWRPDGNLTGPATAAADSVVFKMSTTEKNTSNMSRTFAGDVGTDEMVVFRCIPCSNVGQSVGPAGGPKEFTITWELDDPFLYDPSLGNLLLDFDLVNGSQDLLADNVLSPASTTKWIAGHLGGTTAWGFAQWGGIITEFKLRPIPEPLRGDFDMDGDLDANDIDLLSLDVHTGGGDLTFDLNDDGLVNQEDRNAWVENVFGTFFGDADLNKEVAFADFLSLSSNFSEPGGWAKGDFDGNGTVQFQDFLLLSSNFGNSATAVAAVPEPNAAMLLLVGLVSLVRRRWIVSETRGA